MFDRRQRNARRAVPENLSGSAALLYVASVGITAAVSHDLFRLLTFRPKSNDNAVIRVYAAAGNVIETHEHKGEFKEF